MAKVELDLLKLGCSIIANKDMDGYSTTRLTKILNDNPQKRHGSLGNNMNIWHNEINSSRT